VEPQVDLPGLMEVRLEPEELVILEVLGAMELN
jgi:hypothetical protein